MLVPCHPLGSHQQGGWPRFTKWRQRVDTCFPAGLWRWLWEECCRGQQPHCVLEEVPRSLSELDPKLCPHSPIRGWPKAMPKDSVLLGCATALLWGCTYARGAGLLPASPHSEKHPFVGCLSPGSFQLCSSNTVFLLQVVPSVLGAGVSPVLLAAPWQGVRAGGCSAPSVQPGLVGSSGVFPTQHCPLATCPAQGLYLLPLEQGHQRGT